LAQNLAFCIAFLAVCLDITTDKISNVAIVAFILTGIVYQTSVHGIAGIWWYLKGAGIPLLMLFILFVFRMLGPGDIKLLSVLGGIIGVNAIIKCIALAFLFGAILAIAFIIVCGNFRQRLRYLTDYIANFLKTRAITAYYKPGMQMENFHFSVPIFMSIIIYVGGFY